MRFKSLRGLIVVPGLLLMPALGAFAQTSVDGAIGGTVQDTTGAVIPNAHVVVHNDGTNAEQTLTADSSGYFRALHLAPGLYSVTITATGFGDYRSKNVSVQVGEMTDLEPKMAAGSATQVVQVSGQAPAINTSTPDFAGVVGQNTLHNVPVNNYRWSAYALQTPGVVESGGFGLLSFRGQSTLLNNITVDGMDDNQAFFSEERGRTTVGYSTIHEAIQEFQVNTSNYSVEYGRAAGGVVNAVTKSGSNQFHGEGYYFDRDSQWAAFNDQTDKTIENANDTFTSEPFKPTDLRRQYGFTLGGPIVKDKLFFFFAADRYYHDFPAVAVPSAPSTFYETPNPNLTSGLGCAGITTKNDTNYYADEGACALMTNLNLPNYSTAVTDYNKGLAGLTSMLGQGPRYAGQTIFFPRIDWQINAKNHATFEANRLRFTSPSGQQTNATATYGLASFGNIYVRDTWGIAKLDTIVSDNKTNELRYQYGRDFNFAYTEPSDSYEQNTLLHTPGGYTNPNGIPPYVSVQDGFAFGTPDFLNRPAYPDERRWQVADTFTWTHGNHIFKFGGDYIHTYDLSENLVYAFGGYVYDQTAGANGAEVSGLANYLTDYYMTQGMGSPSAAAHYTSYTQGFGPLGFQFTTGDYSGFFEDQWKVNPRLSLMLGMRYDYEQTPSAQLPNPAIPGTQSLPSDKHEIGPRVGFAYDIFGDGKTVVRGGFGVAYGRLINSTIYNALAQTGMAGGQSEIELAAGQTAAPTFPQVIPGSLSSPTPPSVDYFASNFKNPEVLESDLTMQRAIGWNTVVSASWLGSFGRDMPDFVDTNLPTSVPVTYTVVNTDSKGLLPNGEQITVPFYGYASGTGAPAAVDYGRPNQKFGAMQMIFSGVTTNYEAFVAEISHRLSSNVQFQANFTHSHSLDYGTTNTTFTASSGMTMQDPHNIKLDYGNSLENVPNRFVFTAVVNSPWHFSGIKGYILNNYEFAPSFAAQSGNDYSADTTGASSNLITPYTSSGYITGTDSGNESYNGADGAYRIPLVQRDAFRQPPTYMFDGRISKRIVYRDKYNLELLAEGFNLFNHQNVTETYTTAYSVGTDNGVNTLTEYTSTPFGKEEYSNNNNIYTPRELQLGVRFQF